MTCKDCFHYEVCKPLANCGQVNMLDPSRCGYFKDKSQYVEMPCKVGDTVWFIEDQNSLFSEPKPEVIFSIEVWKNETVFFTKSRMFFNDKFLRENAFFTREKAELALKAKKGGGEK